MRKHDAHFTALHVAAESRKDMRAGDSAFIQSQRDRFVTGGNVDFNVPVQQPWARTQRKSVPVFPNLCVASGLPRPHSEFQFHPVRRWQFDYAFPLSLIAVEVEGGIWRKGGGAHSHPSNIERDLAKYNAAAILGWRILRYAPEDLGNAIHDLRVVLA